MKRRLGVMLLTLGGVLFLAAAAMGYARIFGAGPEWTEAAILTGVLGVLSLIAGTFPGFWWEDW